MSVPVLTERDTWASDFEQIAARIRPWVAYGVDASGEEYSYVTENAPGLLAQIYHRLVSLGTANGWLNPKKEDAR
ncbi:MAG: hypothetical protein K0Q52_164 [Microbacterium sp.]|jgi:hypothetical protein|nr:hypothetical protein [Microbacterium sp.]